MKGKGPHKPSKGRKHTAEEVSNMKVKYLSILDFIDAYSLDISVEAIGYHMKNDKIDYMQPSRDRFVLITRVTLEFYDISLKS